METSFAWSLCLSVFVVLISIVPLTYSRLKVGYSVENMSAPRALFDELSDFGKRAVWCHQNCWESITLHAPACLICLISGVVSPIAVIAAWVHPFVRLIYLGAYVGDIPLARGICWATGILCSMVLYKEGLITLISS
tara:strand:+ start:3454 stop:3864 length:411 start_codon:yes stop_codon:yes gene_type:complete